MATVENGPASASIECSTVDGGATLVTIAGELDLSTVPGVEVQLWSQLDAASKRVIFELSAVTFMDSSGIAMLLRAAERVGSVEVRNPSVPVRLVIRATGLLETFGMES